VFSSAFRCTLWLCLADDGEKQNAFPEEPAAVLRDDPAMEPIRPMKPMSAMAPMEPIKSPERWWPKDLGDNPNSAGGQNEARYAFFGDRKRLALDLGDGSIQIFDTGDHRISGVQQHQSGRVKRVTFRSQHGEVDLEKLERA
jgi:hypothetical protein